MRTPGLAGFNSKTVAIACICTCVAPAHARYRSLGTEILQACVEERMSLLGARDVATKSEMEQKLIIHKNVPELQDSACRAVDRANGQHQQSHTLRLPFHNANQNVA